MYVFQTLSIFCKLSFNFLLLGAVKKKIQNEKILIIDQASSELVGGCSCTLSYGLGYDI